MPERSLVIGSVLPRSLKYLMRVERQAPIEQTLRVREGIDCRQLEVIGNTRNTMAARRKWSTKLVARPGVPRPPGFVAIAPGHLPIIAVERPVAA